MGVLLINFFLLLLSINSELLAAVKEGGISFQGYPILLETDGYQNELYLGYFISDDKYVLKHFVKNKVINLSEEGFNITDVKVTFTENTILVFYIIKEKSTGYKYVKYRIYNKENLQLEKEAKLNTQKDSLRPLQVFKNDSIIIVTWIDEREIKHRYTYFNYSTDNGKTFQINDAKLNDDDYPIFQLKYLFRGNKHHFYGISCFKLPERTCGIVELKLSDLKGEREKTVIESKGFEDWGPSFVEAIDTSDGVLVFWAGQKGIFYAHNYNNKWESFSLPIDKEVGVSRIQVAKDKNENIYVVASYRTLFDDKSKDNVYLFISNDKGRSWSKPINIRNYPYNRTLAINPTMYIDNRGYIYVFWQDHRNIRGDIYMNYSKDGGKTWQPQDINLSQPPPGSKNDHYPEVVGIDDKIYLFWYQTIGDTYSGDRKIMFREISVK